MQPQQTQQAPMSDEDRAQQLLQGIGYKPPTNNGTQGQVQSGYDRIDAMIAARSGSANQEGSQGTEADSPNILQKGLGLFANPILESGARAGQAFGSLLLEGINKASGGALDKFTPEKNLDSALERVLNTKQNLPITGGELKPANQETPESVGGRALSTVALGLGSVPLSGAALGAGQAMEDNRGPVGVAVESVASMLGAKILDVGLPAAEPYISSAIAKYGTPIVEKLQEQLPEWAKPALDSFINAGNTVKAKLETNGFNAMTDTIRTDTGVPFEKTRSSAWQDLQPKTTPSVKSSFGQKGNVTEPGLISKAKIMPTKEDEPLIDSYQKLYDNGSINNSMSYKEKLDAINQRASELNQQQKEFLATHDKAVSVNGSSAEKGIFPTLDETAKNNSLIFSKDQSAKGAYDSAIEVFKKNLDTGKAAGTTEGATTLTKIDDALTKFDAEMDKFGAWERSKSGQLTETDKARIQAIRDVHSTARDYISNNLPPNNPWKATRLEESHLYTAADRVGDKLGETVGHNKITQFMKDHPLLKRGALWGAGTLGVGEIGRKFVTGSF